jgi:hypothetical protein
VNRRRRSHPHSTMGVHVRRGTHGLIQNTNPRLSYAARPVTSTARFQPSSERTGKNGRRPTPSNVTIMLRVSPHGWVRMAHGIRAGVNVVVSVGFLAWTRTGLCFIVSVIRAAVVVSINREGGIPEFAEVCLPAYAGCPQPLTMQVVHITAKHAAPPPSPPTHTSVS